MFMSEPSRSCPNAQIDALVASRSLDNEHEASRRLKTELFTQVRKGCRWGRRSGFLNCCTGPGLRPQMDGVLSSTSSGRVMVMATTNCPWDLDDALRRRLEKRIYVPLPDAAARVAMFRLNLGCIPGASQSEELLRRLADATAGYSGADIHVVSARGWHRLPLRGLLSLTATSWVSQLCREAAMMPMRRLLQTKTPQVGLT
jgi:SpoVK/Ycf46/Vps4 family AAA+-type ATPase